MRYFPHRTPSWLQLLFPQFLWNKPAKGKEVYLTFDDGPIPEATPMILDYLREFEARATFFCVGENVDRYPEIFRQVVEQGHSVGNHTYHHLNGWKTPNRKFLQDVLKCQEVMASYYTRQGKPLMRPPYGRIKPKQWRTLKKDYEIVMWDVLSGDFSSKIDSTACLNQSIRHSKIGSIVLFHDSVKTINKLKTVLPGYLDHFSRLGFTFQAL